MYHPTTRLLTILELLQTREGLSGAKLAQYLEISPRSIRRYVMMLQDMGLRFPFTVINPPELRTALRETARTLLNIANAVDN
jgi:predicted DNA-binding transcriptional regulator YafY